MEVPSWSPNGLIDETVLEKRVIGKVQTTLTKKINQDTVYPHTK